MRKRFLSMLMASCLLLTLAPAAFAEEGEASGMLQGQVDDTDVTAYFSDDVSVNENDISDINTGAADGNVTDVDTNLPEDYTVDGDSLTGIDINAANGIADLPGDEIEGNDATGIQTIATENDVAEINGQYFQTVDAAIGAVQAGETVKLLQDVTLADDTSLTILDKQNVILDLNGHTITGSSTGDILAVCGSCVEVQNSTETKGAIINTAADASSSSVVTVQPSDTYHASLVLGGGVKLENQSTKSTAKGLYVDAPSDGALTANAVVNDAYIKSNANAVGTKKDSKATAVMNGGTIEISGKNTTISYNVTINGGIFVGGNLYAKLDNIAAGKLVLLEKNEAGVVVYTVVDEANADYSARVKDSKLCVKPGTDLSVLSDIGKLAGTVEVVKRAELHVSSFGNADKQAPTSLTLDLADGVTLSGEVKLMLADIAITGNGTVAEDMFTPANANYQVSMADGVYQGRFAEGKLGATVTNKDTGTVKYYQYTSANMTNAINTFQNVGNKNTIVTLYHDYTKTKRLSIKGAGNELRLNGYTYTYTGSDVAAFVMNSKAELAITGGILDCTSSAATSAIQALGSATSNVTITIGKDATVKGNGIFMQGKTITLNVYGTIDTTGTDNIPIDGNGTQGQGPTTINVYDGAVIKSDVVAIFHPQSGTLNIEGGEITGSTGIYMRSGTLNVTGGTIQATGEKNAFDDSAGSGWTSTGNAVLLYACDYPGGAPVVNSFGGDDLTVISKNAESVVCHHKESTQDMDNKTFITGGNFSDSVVEYVSDGLKAELYSTAENKDAPFSYHSSVAAAQEAAGPDDTINDLTVTKDDTKTYYTVTLVYGNGAAREVYTMEVTNGSTIYSLRATAPNRSGYTFSGWKSEDGSIYQPGDNVGVTKDTTLTAQWNPIVVSNPITVPSVAGGKVAVSPNPATEGDTVTLTVTPDKGYELSSLTVTDDNGNNVQLTDNGNGTYTFTMPDSEVKVNASFSKIVVKDPVKDCPQDKTCPAVAFSDVPAKQWYHDGVHYCVANKLMVGIGDNMFAPNTNLSRAMLVTILYRADGSPAVGAPTFADVPANQWYSKAVAWAAEKKIVVGIGNNLYAPDQDITRQDMATILYRYSQYKGADMTGLDNLSAYRDAGSISSYAKAPVQWCVAHGIISGKPGKILDPKGNAIRAEVATVLYRTMAK